MTKKDFIALADMIAQYNCITHDGSEFTGAQLEALAEFCQSQNSKFNREHWIDYIDGKCGPSGGSIK